MNGGKENTSTDVIKQLIHMPPMPCNRRRQSHNRIESV